MADQTRQFVSLGMFIIDEFEFIDPKQKTRRSEEPQIGGGGTYATIGARIWLPPDEVGMIVDRGHDWPETIQNQLQAYGQDMWLYRDDKSRETTRARNTYREDARGFQYLNPRVRITPRDLSGTKLEDPKTLHFICSPSRARIILNEVANRPGWTPVTIYEPIPDRCIPEELPALLEILPQISILSPNAEEALSLLAMPLDVTRGVVEEAALQLLSFGVGAEGRGVVIIRSGHLGAYVANVERGGQWVEAYWTPSDSDRVVDVTGAGNAFLGGLGAGLHFTKGDPFEATLYGTISASFVIEQEGLPHLEHNTSRTETGELWNGSKPQKRLESLRKRIRNRVET
ncbi:Ribokinase-like protein [Cristinia sonorae]|uniref:Ribokinase-like protein n=1 Tax=Cristinia sonorae TaxID=1940300 RepID=A0A8K0UYS5_9AGAR|nr:Ribokinase-like protein [Cristinia sonorae]